jgi:glycosyltransferase involved in cell wall biosynthesis
MITPRHICHVTTAHPWFDARIFERLCVGLRARGYRVTLVAPVDEPREERGISIVPTGLRGKFSRLVGVPGLLRRLAALDADIYHFHDPELLPWMALFCRLRPGTRVVYDVHEFYPESVVGSNYFGWRPISRLAGAVFNLVEPALGRRLDGVVGVTPPITRRFAGGRARVATVRNVLPLDVLTQALDPVELPSPRTLVLGGIMDRDRLMPELLAAIASLTPRWPDLALLGFGDYHWDPYGREIDALVRGLGLESRVTFRPRVPWATLQAHLVGSVAGLVLLRDERRYHWSLPNRLFEFMAHGVPVVAMDYPLIGEVVREADCGLLLKEGSAAAIAAALDRLLADPAHAGAMGARGRDAVRTRHNWAVDLARVDALYAEL